jgi:hypothetical protein
MACGDMSSGMASNLPMGRLTTSRMSSMTLETSSISSSSSFAL